MSVDERPVRQSPAGTAASSGPGEANLLELAGDWVAAAGARVRDTAELALAEARLAATSMALMPLPASLRAVCEHYPPLRQVGGFLSSDRADGPVVAKGMRKFRNAREAAS